MFKRLRIWLLGGEFVLEDEDIVLLRFHQYGVLENLWLKAKDKLKGEPFEHNV